MNDSYGSVLREKMKESMSEPFTPLNRRLHDPHALTPTQRIIGTLAIVAVAVEAAYQIGLKVHP